VIVGDTAAAALRAGDPLLLCFWHFGLGDTVRLKIREREDQPPPPPPPPPPDPGARAPDIAESFAYSGTATLLASPIYLRSEDYNAGRIVLDQTVRYDGHPTMRYDYPARPGQTEYTISRTIDLRPAGSVREVWVEAAVRFEPQFTLDGGVQNYGQSLKLLHVGIYGPAGRFGLNFENGDGGQLNAEGPNDDYDAMYLRTGVRTRSLFDGQWHVIRYHVKLGATDMHEVWVDGVYQGRRTGQTSATRLWAIALARNLNQGPPRAQSMWWGRVRVWYADPGWGS
jgi:hypothetical protein